MEVWELDALGTPMPLRRQPAAQTGGSSPAGPSLGGLLGSVASGAAAAAAAAGVAAAAVFAGAPPTRPVHRAAFRVAGISISIFVVHKCQRGVFVGTSTCVTAASGEEWEVAG